MPPGRDNLDVVELVMAIEEAIGEDTRLSAAEKESLIQEIAVRIERGEFDEGDLDDDTLGILVRKIGPRGPLGQASAKVKPEEAQE